MQFFMAVWYAFTLSTVVAAIEVAIVPFWQIIGKFPPDNIFEIVDSSICHLNIKYWSLHQDKLDFSMHMTRLKHSVDHVLHVFCIISNNARLLQLHKFS